MKNQFVLAAASMLALVACGDENTTNVNETTGLEVVAKGEKLAKCTDEIEGKMVYVTDSSAVYYCIDGEWTDLNGADGSDGVDGKSAYQIAVDSGYTGTEAEWLESLKGSCNCSSEAVSKESSSSEESSSSVESSSSEESSSSVESSSSEESSASKESSSSEEESSSSIAVVDPSDVVTGTMTDARDGKTYKTVTIGTQTWMAENLNYAYLQKTATLDSSSFCYGNEPDSCAKYGRLYLWSAAMDSVAEFSDAGEGCGWGAKCFSNKDSKNIVRGVCPEGWHLPDSTAWQILFKALGDSSVGVKMDVYGLNVLRAGGYEEDVDSYYSNGYGSFFWSATGRRSGGAYFASLYVGSEEASLLLNDENYGYSVRCVKD